ncbi:MAG: hypothetical protein IKL46_06470 [Clostridia bacterium]|nr:hypothetical protein [Clostridia bacterium]MBR3592481.1 hypothetical protein [Clostridia bacterium]
MKDYKYNYVFYSVDSDFLKPIFSSLSKYPFVKVFDRAFNANFFIQKFFFLHWSAKLNKIVKLPFKNIWYKKMCCHNFENNKPICYVFVGGKYVSEDKAFLKYIKNLNPNNKCIMLCLDLLQKTDINTEKLKENIDKIITYDLGEAHKYTIDYLNMDYYTPIIDVTTPNDFENDVYFLGYVKDRLDDIHNTYKYFVKNDVKCKFIICGTKPEERISGDGLIYQKPISYIENLQNVRKSKCILEIIQGQSVAPTLRLREAKTYKRRLITNNTNPEYIKSLTKDNLCVYSDVKDIDIDFIKSDINYKNFTDEYSSPIKLINYLEETL